jgi:hypothetical protein
MDRLLLRHGQRLYLRLIDSAASTVPVASLVVIPSRRSAVSTDSSHPSPGTSRDTDTGSGPVDGVDSTAPAAGPPDPAVVDHAVVDHAAVDHAAVDHAAVDSAASDPAEPDRPGLGAQLGADWAAVLVAAVLVLLAVTGLLPSIPFLVK